MGISSYVVDCEVVSFTYGSGIVGPTVGYLGAGAKGGPTGVSAT